MKSINGQMIAAAIIHTLLTLFLSVDPEYSFLALFTGAIVLTNLLGMALIASGHKKTGAKIFMLSSLLLVPIGAIGAFGARKIIDQEAKEKFYTQTQKENKNERY